MRKRRYLLLLSLPLLLLLTSLGWFTVPVQQAQAVNNALALTPPMRWNSWNKFFCGVTEANVRQATDTSEHYHTLEQDWTGGKRACARPLGTC